MGTLYLGLRTAGIFTGFRIYGEGIVDIAQRASYAVYQCQFSKCRVNYPLGRRGLGGPHVTNCKSL